MALVEKLLKWSPGGSQARADTWMQMAAWPGFLGDSVAGISVSPDTALKISTVYACVGLLSETIASLPLVIFRYIENEDGRERARNHPLYPVLHDQPNETQTAFEFVQMMQTHALMSRNGCGGCAKIIAGPRGFADQLEPLHPDNVRKEKLANGRIRYQVREDDGREKPYLDEDIFEVRGLSLDGWNSVSVVSYARDSFGLSMAAERYGGRFFRNDSRPGGVLTTEGKLNGDAAKRIKGEWEALHSGTNQNRVAVLEQGLKWQQVGISPEEAQFLGTREFQAEDICRWFRVPPHMVGLTSKATSWGSGLEEMNLGFLAYTLRPWLTRWTQAIKRDLILATETYFADFIIEHLLKGDIQTRYNAYAVARQWGWLSVNDIRRKENENPIPGGDAYLQPLNMAPAGEQGSRGAGEKEHYRLLAEESAARLVRKEIAAIGRLATDGHWSAGVERFYQDHAALVGQAMQISPGKARAYCERGQAEWLATGPGLLPDFEARRVKELADLAMNNSGG
jgi:HK97 family phage portal protein